jgi:hypothetical protein
MTRKYKIFLGLIVLWAIAVPLFASLSDSWFSLEIPKLLDDIGVLESFTMCTNSITGSCTTSVAIRFAIWPYISMLVALLGVSYVIDLILRRSFTVGKTILSLLFVITFTVLAIFLDGGQLYVNFLTDVLGFTSYSRNLLFYYNIYLFFLLLGLFAIAEGLFSWYNTSYSQSQNSS